MDTMAESTAGDAEHLLEAHGELSQDMKWIWNAFNQRWVRYTGDELYTAFQKQLEDYKSQRAEEEEEARQLKEQQEIAAYAAAEEEAKRVKAAAEEEAKRVKAAAEEQAKSVKAAAEEQARVQAAAAAAAGTPKGEGFARAASGFQEAEDAAKVAWNMQAENREEQQPAAAKHRSWQEEGQAAAKEKEPAAAGQWSWKEQGQAAAKEKEPAAAKQKTWQEEAEAAAKQKEAAKEKLAKDKAAEWPYYQGHPFYLPPCCRVDMKPIVKGEEPEYMKNYFEQRELELQDDYAPHLQFTWGLDEDSADEPAFPTRAEKRAAKKERKRNRAQNAICLESMAAGNEGSSATASSSAAWSSFQPTSVGPPAAAAPGWTQVGPAPARQPAATGPGSCTPSVASAPGTPRTSGVKFPEQDLQKLWAERQSKCDCLLETLQRMQSEALEVQLTAKDCVGVAEEMKGRTTLQRHYDELQMECKQWEQFADISGLQYIIKQKMEMLDDLQKKDSCSSSCSIAVLVHVMNLFALYVFACLRILQCMFVLHLHCMFACTVVLGRTFH